MHMEALRKIQRIADIIERLLQGLVVLSIAAIAALLNVSVFFRYVLNAALTWTNELSRYLLILSVFCGGAIAARHRMLAEVRFVVDGLPRSVRRGTRALSHGLVTCFLVLCIVSPRALIERAARTGTLSAAMQIPMVWVYHMVRIGFAVILLFVLFGIVDNAAREAKR